MTVCYFIIGVIIISIGILIAFSPDFIRKIMTIIKDNDLFFIPGIIEIIMALFALFYRTNARFEVYITIVSLFIFIDGVFYLASSKSVKMTYEIFLAMDIKAYKLYSIIIIVLGLGFLINTI